MILDNPDLIARFALRACGAVFLIRASLALLADDEARVTSSGVLATATFVLAHGLGGSA